MRSQSATCASCGFKKAQVRDLTSSYGKGASLLVVEHVPIIVCPKCGESYLTA